MLKVPLHYYDNVSACSFVLFIFVCMSAKIGFGGTDLFVAPGLDKLGKGRPDEKVMSGGMNS